MSGGSMRYLYLRVLEAEFDTDTPERILFKAHLEKVAAALKAIEWVDSADYGPGDENAAIMDCLGPQWIPAQHAPGLVRVYISGPMTGIPDLNFPAFFQAADKLAALGYEVVNPVTLNPDPNISWAECMRVDIAALMTCNSIYMLGGWQDSKGARLEYEIAANLDFEILELK